MEKQNPNLPAWKVYEQAISYSANGEIDVAVKLLENVLAKTDDTTLIARCYLRLGGLAEQVRQCSAALDYYEHGLALPQTETFTAYFLNNNAAYCLNMMARHQEAETLCRKAIETDASKHNAWKNLGVSLDAQGDLLGAAWAYVEATKIEPRDARAFVFLQRLIADHAELRSRFSGILLDRAACREAFEATLLELPRKPFHTHEICCLKYVPGTGYFEIRNGVEKLLSSEAIEQVYTVAALKLLDNYPNVRVSIVEEDKHKKPQAKGGNTSTSRDYENLAPCLVAEGEMLERLKIHFDEPTAIVRLCRRCKLPLEKKATVAGLKPIWVCKTLGCPKGIFPRKKGE